LYLEGERRLAETEVLRGDETIQEDVNALGERERVAFQSRGEKGDAEK
jgi:hypothetical protein